jgi:phosphate transport system permease protein
MVGESAALLFTAGMGYHMPTGFFEHIQSAGSSLTVQMYLFFTEFIPGVDRTTTPFAVASVLMIIVLVLNTITGIIGAKFKKGNNS